MLIQLQTVFSLLIAHWRAVALGLLILTLTYAGWHARGIVEESRQAKTLQESISAHLAGEAASYSVGMNLETGLNDYQLHAIDIDRKVHDATAHDTGNRFDAAGVQRTAERIAAGEAARKRHGAVQ